MGSPWAKRATSTLRRLCGMATVWLACLVAHASDSAFPVTRVCFCVHEGVGRAGRLLVHHISLFQPATIETTANFHTGLSLRAAPTPCAAMPSGLYCNAMAVHTAANRSSPV